MLPSNKCLMKRGFRPRGKKKLPFMKLFFCYPKAQKLLLEVYHIFPHCHDTLMWLTPAALLWPLVYRSHSVHAVWLLLWAWYKGSAGHRSSWRAWPSSLSFHQSTVSALSLSLRQWSALIKFDILVLPFVFHSCHSSAALLPTSLGKKNTSEAELEVNWTAEDLPQ